MSLYPVCFRYIKLALPTLLAFTVLVPTAPITSGTALAQSSPAISQGFNTDAATARIPGTLVSTKLNTPQEVEPASTGTVDRLVGVTDNNPLVALSDGNSQVQVVTSGSTDDEYICSGDYWL